MEVQTSSRAPRGTSTSSWTFRALVLSALSVMVVGTLAGTLTGCSDDFAGEEMRLGTEDKIRPLGVILDPPEAAPGETVEVTLHWYDPRPAATTVAWRVALEYDPGFYGVDPVERRFVDLPRAGELPVSTTDQGDGFFFQRFAFTVPDSVILWAPNLASLQDDDLIAELAAVMTPWVDPSPNAWDEFLGGLDADDLAAMDAGTAQVIRTMADLFAAQIRFRATLEHGATVEVTRNLTVRYSAALGSPNTNESPRIEDWSVVGIPGEDILWSERAQYGDQLEWIPIAEGDVVSAEVTLAAQPEWTYYLVCESAPQRYTSPYPPAGELDELLSYRWFRFRADDPASEAPFFVRDDGDEADSFDLDEAVRIEPVMGNGPTRYRVCLVIRDERPEWARYQATPGQRLAFTDIVFGP